MLNEGLLTEETIRKYPLRLSSLYAVCKVYAINNNLAYKLVLNGTKGKFTSYYLTDSGLEMFLNFFRTHSYRYCLSLFTFILRSVTPEEFEDVDNIKVFSNFRGTSGVKSVPGTKQRAMVIRKVKRCERKYEFDSIAEAREHLRVWLAYYPLEEFTLYRIRTQKGVTFKEKIPLVTARTYSVGGNDDTR